MEDFTQRLKVSQGLLVCIELPLQRLCDLVVPEAAIEADGSLDRSWVSIDRWIAFFHQGAEQGSCSQLFFLSAFGLPPKHVTKSGRTVTAV